MGGSSTSHSAVLRGHKDATSSGLNLHSWQGLTEVLRAGKNALKDADAYAEFRNLVLEYAQKGGDVELRKKIDTIIATFSVENPKVVEEVVPVPVPNGPLVEEKHDNPVPSVPQKSEMPKAPTHVSQETIPTSQVTLRVSHIGTQRMVPSFEKKQHPPATFIPTEVQESIEKKEEEHAPENRPESTTETPLKESVKRPHEVTPQSVPPESSEVVVQKGTIEEYKARIAEIKHQVHERIGNPAALMDSQNDLGKKYMSALLSALKATGSGQSAHSEMATLEAVVAQLLKQGNEKDVTSFPQPTPVILEEEKKEPVEKKDVAPTSVIPLEELSHVPVKEADESAVAVPVTEEAQLKSEDKVETQVPMPDVTLERKEEILEKTLVKKSVVPVRVRSFTPPVPVQAPIVPPATLPVEQVSKPTVPHQAESENVTPPQTELSLPEITTSLHQLLDEWSIFAGSGLFGIGPGGADHPLYKKIASLSMGEVVAGRWENADPKVVKVIKQYVDAWRHEQGVAYTITETFEHYLRRVVQRILKRQEG